MHMKMQRPEVVKCLNNLGGKYKVRGFTLPKIKTNYRAMEIKAASIDLPSVW